MNWTKNENDLKKIKNKNENETHKNILTFE